MIESPFKQMEDTALARRDRIVLIKRTHDIFCGLHGKNIKLNAGDSPGHTDVETFISIPFEDDHSDLIHKHEWQHIFMGSDIRARGKFVDEYSAVILGAAPHVHPGQIKQFLHFLVNGLDDLRVNDLWKKPYPQSAEDLENRWQEIILAHGGYQQDLITYTMAVGLGLRDSGRMLPSKWDEYLIPIKEGLTKIYGFGGIAPMIGAKYILDRMFQKVLESFIPAPQSVPLHQSLDLSGSQQRPLGQQNQPAQTHGQLIDQLVSGQMKSKSLEFFKDTKKPEGEDRDPIRTMQTVRTVMSTSTVEQIQDVLEQSRQEVSQALKLLMSKTKLLSADQKLLRGLDGRAEFRDVSPEDVKVFELSQEDTAIIDRLKGTFARLMDRKKLRTSEMGSTINIGAYIDLITGNGDGEVFEDEVAERGFRAVILIDMSGSMATYWKSVSRACKVLAKSMKLPFSKLEVWGFSGNVKGNVFIHRFKDVEKGYDVTSEEAWGTTPLHIATEVAIRHLSQRSGESTHLFVITDGLPMHVMRTGEAVSPAHLIRQVRGNISQGLKKGVHTLGFVLGDSISDDIATVMFGPKSWTRAETEVEVFIALVALMQGAFVSYLLWRR